MYQVLIVDDEYLAQNKICTMINWEDYGFHIAGTASNGQEAITFIKNNSVDVVFTDICMHSINGIELTKYIKSNHPDTEVIIMSSYSDFEYVKECFAANARDYVLKHLLTPEILIGILDKLSSSYLQHRIAYSITYNEYVKTRQYRQHIIDLIRRNTSDDPVFNAVVIVAKVNNHILLEFVHSSNELQTFYRHIINTISQILRDLSGFVIFQSSDNNIVIFLPFHDKAEAKIVHELRDYIQQINYSIKKFFDLSLQWGISCVSSPTYSLAECYDEALQMLNSKPIIGKNENDIGTAFNSLSIDDEKNLISAVQTLNNNNIDAALDKIFEHIPSQQLSLNIIVSELITLANKICTEFKVDIRSLGDTLKSLNLAMNSNCSKEEILSWNKNLFHSIVDAGNNGNRHKQKYSAIIQNYIHQHYSEDISLKQIANSVRISESYLCTVFKEETGETISNYLANFRIEKAKELLIKNVDIKYLYSDVGFKSYNYFFVTFKKIVGCTPRQYKVLHSKNNR